jgi:hypothetical protein
MDKKSVIPFESVGSGFQITKQDGNELLVSFGRWVDESWEESSFISIRNRDGWIQISSGKECLLVGTVAGIDVFDFMNALGIDASDFGANVTKHMEDRS